MIIYHDIQYNAKRPTRPPFVQNPIVSGFLQGWTIYGRLIYFLFHRIILLI